MFARVTTVYIKPDRVDKAIEIFNNSIIPAAREQDGYQGANVLVDRESGKGIVITFWKTEEKAIANEKNRYYQEQLMKTVVLFTADPRREGFELAVKDRI
jgi:heme-degrading monooxygenase HmoA